MQLEDIRKLANMARVDMSDEEMKGIAKDFDPILAYVGQVQEALKLNKKIARQDLVDTSEGKKPEDYFLYNVMREDVATNKRDEYTENILKDAPDTQDGFLKVKQIL